MSKLRKAAALLLLMDVVFNLAVSFTAAFFHLIFTGKLNFE